MTPDLISVAHSPDTDDVFMCWALATGRLKAPGREYSFVAADIEVLNREALAQVYDVTAISYGAYPYFHRYYALLDSGGSIGDGYGPVLVARADRTDRAAPRRIAIPGRLTTAYLAARLALGAFEAVEVPFKDVGAAVLSGHADAGILIHEGQLLHGETRFRKLLDLGAWWKEDTGLPLPLGANAIRRDLERPLRRAIAADLKQSIVVGREHLDEALEYTMRRCPGLDTEAARRYLDMYVNAETISASHRTRDAARLLFDRARKAGLIDEDVAVDYENG